MSSQILPAILLGGAATAMAVPIGLKVAGYELDFLSNLGFTSGPRGNAVAWVSAVVLALAHSAFSIRHIPEIGRQWHLISWLKFLAILAATAAGIVEEGIFRRMILDGVLKRGGNAALQLTASSVAMVAWFQDPDGHVLSLTQFK